MKSRFHQILLIATFVPFCWLAMMGVHELGHVAAGIATGGEVSKVVLHPLTISRTDLISNPHPLIVVWSGPLAGTLLPILWAWISKRLNRPTSFLQRFFAGFCCIANGTYIGAGSFDRVGDCGVMLDHGTPIWLLWAFGVAAVAIGLRLWHGLGKSFGIGKDADAVDPKISYASTAIFIGSLCVCVLLSPAA